MYQPECPPEPDPTGVAIIGCGYWGMNYVRVLSELADAYVAAVCEQRTSRLDDVARRFGDVPLTTDVDEALHRDDVEAIVVCTQAVTHRDIAGRALELGKHVLVEKPLAVNVEQANELIGLAVASDRVLLTGHTFVYNSGVACIKRLIEAGTLGRTYYVYSRRTNMGPFRYDVNALWDLAPHDIAIFNHILGVVPEWVSAVGSRLLGGAQEDVGFITLEYPGGIMGHIHVSWADPHKVREFVIVGSDRRMAFNDLNVVERVRVFDRGVKPDHHDGKATTFGEHHLMVRNGAITSPDLPVTEPLKHLTGHFVHCIRRGERPRTPATDGRDVVAVMSAVDLSVAENGAPVPVHTDASREHRGPLAGAIG
jgi:predicted dehydrogenase